MAFGVTFQGPMMSFNNCELKINGVRVIGFTKLDIEDGIKTELEFGNSMIPIGAGPGQWEGSISGDQHAQEAIALQAMLNVLAGGTGFAFAEVNMSLTFNTIRTVVNGGTPFQIKRVEIPKLRFLKPKYALVNDGKSTICSWGMLLMEPVGFSSDGATFVYSCNPEVWSTSNSLSIGLGGTINIAG